MIQQRSYEYDHPPRTGTRWCGHMWPEWLNIVEYGWILRSTGRKNGQKRWKPKSGVYLLCTRWSDMFPTSWYSAQGLERWLAVGQRYPITVWRQGTQGFVEPTGKMLTLTSSWGSQRDFYFWIHDEFFRFRSNSVRKRIVVYQKNRANARGNCRRLVISAQP